MTASVHEGHRLFLLLRGALSRADHHRSLRFGIICRMKEHGKIGVKRVVEAMLFVV